MPPSGGDRLRVTRVGMADDAHARVGGQDSFEPPGSLRCAIRHDHLPGMLAVADADSPAVMERYPCGAADGVDEGVQDRPIADGIRAIQHPFRLAVRRSHRAGIQVVAPDHDRRLDDPLRHQVIESLPGCRSLPISKPANAGGQSLERDLLARHRQPAVQVLVFWE